MPNQLFNSNTTRADSVFTDLRTRIVEGEITPSSKLSEPELAKYYQISRSTLRDALSRIEACGLVERKANIGYRVVALSTEGLLELFQVRESLEGMACRLAAQNMSENQIVQLNELLNIHQQDEPLQRGQGYIQQEGDLDFHYQIVMGSGNKQLIRLLCEELYYLVRMYRYQFGMPSPRAKRAFNEHQNIIQAITDKDGELAEILMRRHIAASRLNVEKRMNVNE
ncbi:GntR family transcriptional regulator [Paraglaciecola aquimarina]|uniref:GntR family transcriptional regulator n=1 Tax=Paraglaciecola algarum TaxID=3050085 RepID=A0ABS9D342_9ALTE|nr:GntR family transcriptional regulator [Paraglaciecola sp. G1-23]MCF2947155.1 GntR family transcriptional regulator [Paraglaciecola sp. G1-23]